MHWFYWQRMTGVGWVAGMGGSRTHTLSIIGSDFMALGSFLGRPHTVAERLLAALGSHLHSSESTTKSISSLPQIYRRAPTFPEPEAALYASRRPVFILKMRQH